MKGSLLLSNKKRRYVESKRGTDMLYILIVKSLDNSALAAVVEPSKCQVRNEGRSLETMTNGAEDLQDEHTELFFTQLDLADGLEKTHSVGLLWMIS